MDKCITFILVHISEVAFITFRIMTSVLSLLDCDRKPPEAGETSVKDMKLEFIRIWKWENKWKVCFFFNLSPSIEWHLLEGKVSVLERNEQPCSPGWEPGFPIWEKSVMKLNKEISNWVALFHRNLEVWMHRETQESPWNMTMDPLFHLVDLPLMSTFVESVPRDVIKGKLNVIWLPKNN